jgi:hypothetical protein
VLTQAVFNALRSPENAHEITSTLRWHQIVQRTPDRVEVRIVWRGDLDPVLAARITAHVTAACPDLRCVCRAVDAVTLSPSGKFKKVIRAFDSR